MSQTALNALQVALKTRLDGRGTWGNRVYPDKVPAGVTVVRPYVIYFWAGGGERNTRRKTDANIVMTVKCVADTMTDSMAGAAILSDALNDHGKQDNATDFLNGGASWEILTVTEDRIVHLVESFANAADIYHDGAQFRFIMESI